MLSLDWFINLIVKQKLLESMHLLELMLRWRIAINVLQMWLWMRLFIKGQAISLKVFVQKSPHPTSGTLSFQLIAKLFIVPFRMRVEEMFKN